MIRNICKRPAVIGRLSQVGGLRSLASLIGHNGSKTLCAIALTAVIGLGLAGCPAEGTKDDSEEGVLSEIRVSAYPTTIEYEDGKNFSTAGLQVTAYYDNGTYKDVTGSTDPANGTALTRTEGELVTTKTVTVSYAEGDVTKTTTFSVTVKAVPTVDTSKPDSSKYTSLTGDWVKTGEGQRFGDTIDRGKIWDSIEDVINSWKATEDGDDDARFDHGESKTIPVNTEITLNGDRESSFNGKKIKVVVEAKRTEAWVSGSWEAGGTRKDTKSYKVELVEDLTYQRDGKDIVVKAGSTYERKTNETKVNQDGRMENGHTTESWEDERGLRLIVTAEFNHDGDDITRNGIYIFRQFSIGDRTDSTKAENNKGPEEVWVYDKDGNTRFHRAQDNDEQRKSVL